MLRVRLLGRPSAEMDGVAVPGPRGRKAWALLAVLLLADSPRSRHSLTELLFSDAEDPLGALRWTMSRLRRGLDDHVAIDGDPVVVRLGPSCRVDVVDLLGVSHLAGNVTHRDCEADWIELSEPLLVGADALAGPDFHLWLTAARHRVNTARGARLRETACRALTAAQPSVAVMAAARAVAAEPDHPTGRAALVSSLLAAGDHAAALAQLREWSAWIRRELRIGQLLDTRNTNLASGRTLEDADTMSRIQAGKAAMDAGAVTAGLEHLRHAVRLAANRADERVQAIALFALGGGLVHAFAAHCAEGTHALQEAARLARRVSAGRLAAEALRDLAFVENSGGRVEQARRLLSTAATAAADDRHAMSAVRGIEGMFLADRGEHGRAIAVLRRSAQLAESAGRFRQAAWSISIASRSLLQRHELDAAAEHAYQSAQMAIEERWTAMQPWMDVMVAEVDLALGRVVQAEQRLCQAWSMSLVLGDWCWQAMTARGLGLAAFARGDADQALRWLDEAKRRAEGPHDRYVWIHAWVQEAICRITVAMESPRAKAEVARLAVVAATSNQPDFTIRADLYRATLGERSARDHARAMAAKIDNPALARLAAGHRATPL